MREERKGSRGKGREGERNNQRGGERRRGEERKREEVGGEGRERKGGENLKQICTLGPDLASLPMTAVFWRWEAFSGLKASSVQVPQNTVGH